LLKIKFFLLNFNSIFAKYHFDFLKYQVDFANYQVVFTLPKKNNAH